MPSVFPTENDTFTEPSSPSSTALSSAGDGSKNHVQHHRDIGDAIEAMQVEATLLVHSHNGSTARHGSKLAQANTHQSADTDLGPTSIHHTLGHGTNQAAPGNHDSLGSFDDTHGNIVAWPVGSIFMTTVANNPSGSPHNLGGTWTQIQDAFLIGVGGSYTYTGAVVSNPTTHTHAISDTSTSSTHTHTLPSPSDSQAVHDHSVGSTGTGSASHSHSGASSGSIGAHTASPTGGGSSGLISHSHTLNSSTSTSHSHSGGNIADNSSAHTHTVGASSSQGAHDHTVTASSPSHTPPWRAVYTWRRTA